MNCIILKRQYDGSPTYIVYTYIWVLSGIRASAIQNDVTDRVTHQETLVADATPVLNTNFGPRHTARSTLSYFVSPKCLPQQWSMSRCQASVTPDQISTMSNIYRHTSHLPTLYHLIPSSTNLYWPRTSQYHHILTQYHQVPLIIHHLVRHSSANLKKSLFKFYDSFDESRTVYLV